MVDANSKSIDILGCFDCEVSFLGSSRTLRCYVSSNEGLNLFGIEWIEAFEIWDKPINEICDSHQEQLHIRRINHSVINVVELYPQLFNGSIGHCKQAKVKLHLKYDAQPIFIRSCPAPYASRADIEVSKVTSVGDHSAS